MQSLCSFVVVLGKIEFDALSQGSQIRGPRGRFVQPAMLLGNFQIINLIRYLVYSPVFKSARLASEQVPFKQT